MLPFCGPYALSVALQSCLHGMSLPVWRRLLHTPTPRNWYVALRRVKRIASNVVVREGIELFTETLEDSSLPVLDEISMDIVCIISVSILIVILVHVTRHVRRSS